MALLLEPAADRVDASTRGAVVISLGAVLLEAA